MIRPFDWRALSIIAWTIPVAPYPNFPRPPILKRSVFLLQNQLDLLGNRPLD
jgi:hypothetical protein